MRVPKAWYDEESRVALLTIDGRRFEVTSVEAYQPVDGVWKVRVDAVHYPGIEPDDPASDASPFTDALTEMIRKRESDERGQ